MTERGTQSAARNRLGNHSPDPINRENVAYRSTIGLIIKHLSHNNFSIEIGCDHPVKYSKW